MVGERISQPESSERERLLEEYRKVREWEMFVFDPRHEPEELEKTLQEVSNILGVPEDTLIYYSDMVDSMRKRRSELEGLLGKDIIDTEVELQGRLLRQRLEKKYRNFKGTAA